MSFYTHLIRNGKLTAVYTTILLLFTDIQEPGFASPSFYHIGQGVVQDSGMFAKVRIANFAIIVKFGDML